MEDGWWKPVKRERWWYDRQARVFCARREGCSFEEIAQDWGLTERGIRHVWQHAQFTLGCVLQSAGWTNLSREEELDLIRRNAQWKRRPARRSRPLKHSAGAIDFERALWRKVMEE